MPQPRPAPIASGLAEDLAAGIEQGAWAAGDRLPSVRSLARQRRVGIGSVLAAYAQLDRRGLIERRARSGFFARRPPPRPEPRPPAATARAAPPAEIDLDAVAMEVLDRPRPAPAPLGAAVPPAELLPVADLARSVRRIVAAPADWTAYAGPGGAPELVQAIARRIHAAGARVAADELVVTAGAMEALTLALRATCRPGDAVAIETPMFFGILRLIGSLGLRAVEIPAHPRDGMLLDVLREAIEEHPVRAVLTVASYGNPLGACMPEATRRELAGLLAERGIPLIEDDLYGELPHRGPRPGPIRAHDRDGMVLLCSSFSKCIGPGLRVGYVAGGRWAGAIRQLKLTSSFATPTLPQLAVADYLADGRFDRHLRRLRQACAERCAALAEAVRAGFPAGTRVSRPAGGFALWVEMPVQVDALRLHRDAAAAGIAIAPGHLFSAKRRYRHFIRLNAAAYRPDLAPRIAHLGRLAAHLAR